MLLSLSQSIFCDMMVTQPYCHCLFLATVIIAMLRSIFTEPVSGSGQEKMKYWEGAGLAEDVDHSTKSILLYVTTCVQLLCVLYVCIICLGALNQKSREARQE